MNNCLYCYKLLDNNEVDFHEKCSKAFFKSKIAPIVPYNQSDMIELAKNVIKSQSSVTGVQAKLSLDIDKLSESDIPSRFTIVGLWGTYILKPQTKEYKNLPEIEDLTMKLANICFIKTVPHSLIRLQDNTLAYITKRIDRIKREKIHMEDMCQLTEKLTENKYLGSYEQIAKIISKYSSNPLLDLINFFEVVIFSFITGNADMHLKNFSLIKKDTNSYILSPAYDLVSSALVVKNDNEELALTLNGKKRKLKKLDFIKSMELYKIDNKSIDNIFSKFLKLETKMTNIIQKSFLTEDLKTEYIFLIKNNLSKLR